MANPAEQWGANAPPQESPKPDLRLVEGGRKQEASDERISPEEWSELTTKPGMPKPREHGEEAPVDLKALFREDARVTGEKVQDIREKINLPKPREHEAEQISSEEMQEILTKPNMPRPRAHGAEAPVDMKEIMREPAPEPPKFEGELPVPPGQELTAEDIIEEDEAPTVRRAA